MKGIKLAKEHPNDMFSHGLTTWWPVTGAEILRQFREGMHDRINKAVSYRSRRISELRRDGYPEIESKGGE